MEFVNQATGWITGSQGIILKTTNGGDNWQTFQYNSSYRLYSVNFVNENTGYVIGFYPVDYQFQFNKLLKTSNAGSGWVEILSVMGYNDHYTFNSLDFLNESTGFLCTSRSNGFVSTGSVLITTNSGINWNGVNLPTHLAYKKVKCSANGNIFIWGKYQIDVTGMDTNCIFRSTNGGNNWTEIYRSLGIFWRNLSVNENVVSFAGDYSQNSGILIRSLNSGTTWDTIASGNIPLVTNMFFLTGNAAWLSGYNGNIIMTDNSGVNWHYQSQAQSYMLNDIFMLPSCTGYAVGSSGTILKTTNCGITAVINTNEEFPSQFILSQNYPNPFNPATNIKFNIPNAGFVKLAVYDLLGKEIEVLINKELTAGTFLADWDASAYPSGVYHYRIVFLPDNLEPGSYTETKKMVLIK